MWNTRSVKIAKLELQEQELRPTTILESVLNQIMQGGWETHRSIFSHSSVGVFFIGSFIQWSSAIFLAMHWLTVGWPSSLTNNGLAWKLTVVDEELNLINTYTLSYLFVPSRLLRYKSDCSLMWIAIMTKLLQTTCTNRNALFLSLSNSLFSHRKMEG